MNLTEPPPDGFGLIQLFSGDGKGKTSAALGTCVRAIATGKRVAWVAFDKGGEAHYSERKIIRERFPDMELFITGLDRIDSKTHTFRFGVTEEDQREGERGLNIVRELFEKNEHALVVLDEINSSAHLGIVQEAAVLEIIKNKPSQTELILTGRNAPTSFVELADLVTEMKLVKHYFYHGVPAREGLDY